jgi:hypothetical protein
MLKQSSLLQFGLQTTAAHQNTGEADERRKRQRAAAKDFGLGLPVVKVPRKGAGRLRRAVLGKRALVDAYKKRLLNRWRRRMSKQSSLLRFGLPKTAAHPKTGEAEEAANMASSDLSWTDDYLTLNWFKRYGLMEGKSSQDLENVWNTLTEDPETCAVKRRSECLVPEFKGMENVRKESDQQRIVTSRTAGIHATGQFAELHCTGKKLLQEFSQSVRPPPMKRPLNCPVINANMSDQPTLPDPEYYVLKAVAREMAAGIRDDAATYARENEDFMEATDAFEASSSPKKRKLTSSLGSEKI